MSKSKEKKKEKTPPLRAVIVLAVFVVIVSVLVFSLLHTSNKNLFNAFSENGFVYTMVNPKKPELIVEEEESKTNGRRSETLIRKQGYVLGEEELLEYAVGLTENDFKLYKWGEFSYADKASAMAGSYFIVESGAQKVYDAIAPRSTYKIARSGKYLFIMPAATEIPQAFEDLFESLSGKQQKNF